MIKRNIFLRSAILAILVVLVAGPTPGQNASKPPESDSSKLVYADFQNHKTAGPSASTVVRCG